MAFIAFGHIKAKNLEVIGQKEFKQWKGVTRPAIVYAMEKDLLDWTEIGGTKMLVKTAKTDSYSPNESPARKSVN